MKILGIGDCYHDSCATFINNGKILYAANQERLSGIKKDNSFPWKVVNRIIEIYGSDYDFIAIAGMPVDTKTRDFIKHALIYEKNLGVINNNQFKRSLFHYYKYYEQLNRLLKKLNTEVVYVEHHEAHAYSAYLTSGFDNCLIITADGQGDNISLTVNIGLNGKITRLLEFGRIGHSLGFLYMALTKACGLKPLFDEGKLTALSAYGSRAEISDILNYLKDYIKYGTDGYYYISPEFVGDFDFDTLIKQPLKHLVENYKKENLALAVQIIIEEIISSLVRKFLKDYNIKNVALAGGLFANLRLNKAINDLEEVDKIFIHPAMGDDGLAVGAALAIYSRYNNNIQIPKIETIYLGDHFNEEEIINALTKFNRNKNLRIRDIEGSIPQVISEKLVQGKVIGIFRERMEYGPRALGNRSILYRADKKDAKDILNKRKQRPWYQPVCPTILEEFAPSFIAGYSEKNSYPAKFMTMLFNATENLKNMCPAVVHIDGTVRPQILEKKDNPVFYEIIYNVYEKTGVPLVCNTSFNNKGQPIIRAPEDALVALDRGLVDILLLEHYMVEKI